MNKFNAGEKLITERQVAISVFEMNGQKVNEVIEYPKGEVIEILEVLKNESYKIEFWTDTNTLVNGKSVTYEFDQETIEEWLIEEIN